MLFRSVREVGSMPEVRVPEVAKTKEKGELTKRETSDKMKRQQSLREPSKQVKKQKGFVQRMFQRKAI